MFTASAAGRWWRRRSEPCRHGTRLLAITVLTSHDEETLGEIG